MLTIIIIIFIVSAIILLLNDWSTRPPGSPPGPFAWLLIGSVPVRKSLMQYLYDCQRKYGNIFRLQFGFSYLVFLCDYESIKEAFNNPVLQGRPVFHLFLNPYKGKGIVANSGNAWKNTRRFAIRYLQEVGWGRVAHMENIITYEARLLVEEFMKIADKPTEIPFCLNAAVLNVIWKLVADKRNEIVSEKFNKLQVVMHKLLDIFQQRGFFHNMYPFLEGYLPYYVRQKLFNENERNSYDEQIVGIMQDLIEEHKQNLDENNPRDFIDYCLLEITKTNAKVLEEDLRATLVDLFLAGREQTALTIKWYIFFMATIPGEQDKVHAELDKVIGKDRLPSLNDKNLFPYFEATILETIRKRPTGPIGVPHTAEEDTFIQETFIKKGTILIANLEACLVDKKLWKDPHGFNPGHFLIKNGLSVDDNKAGFLPFGHGKRICPAERLVKMELFLFLSILMQNFHFSPAPGEKMIAEPKPNQPLLNRHQPFKIVISKRA